MTARLRAYVRGRVEPAQADDVIGDILLRLVENADAVEAARQPMAWVYRVASNAVTDHYRRKDVERRALDRAGVLAHALEPQTTADGLPDEGAAALAHCVRPLQRPQASPRPLEIRVAIPLTAHLSEHGR